MKWLNVCRVSIGYEVCGWGNHLKVENERALNQL